MVQVITALPAFLGVNSPVFSFTEIILLLLLLKVTERSSAFVGYVLAVIFQGLLFFFVIIRIS